MKNDAQRPDRKICLILPGLDAGGIENYVLRYLQYTRLLPQITVMIRSKTTGDLYPQYKETGVCLQRQSVSYFNVFKWYRLYQFFRKNKFEAVCDFNENFAGVPMLVARLSGVQRRIAFYRRSSHAFKINKQNLIYAGVMNFLVFKNATAILSNSFHALDFFFPKRHNNDRRFRVIPNGVDASKFAIPESRAEAKQRLGISDGLFVVGHSGRFDPAKNHETIFKVAKALCSKYSDIRFLFCGKNTDSKQFADLLDKYNIAENTICVGLRDDVAHVLKAMDLFYFPSVTEGQPNSLIEAMLAGVSIVSSDIEPIKEALPSSVYPQLVDPLDVEQAIKKIEQYYHRVGADHTNDLKEWSVKRFDVNRNFGLFENELI